MALPQIPLPRREVSRSSTTAELSPHKKQQESLNELPKSIQQLQKQNIEIQRIVSEQSVLLSQQQNIISEQLELSKRLIDQFERLTLESQATNILLSELVNIHQSVVSDTDDDQRSIIRRAAYREALHKQY